ncbi:MAG: sodium/proton-translocating pyrophosphatase [Trueperaceae bacterium]|nr:sodium/proton-translocating pyrophosphatase [Trueperaceae bacterium]
MLAGFAYVRLRELPTGGRALTDVSDQISDGALRFLKREFVVLAPFAVVIAVAAWFALGGQAAIAFAVGATASSVTAVVGMAVATRANVRTTQAAHTSGGPAALNAAFGGGAIVGLTLASLGLIGLGTLAWAFGLDAGTATALQTFGVDASLVALFFRVGGGIYTKGADVGADEVGKLEENIPEDDPRNPGVIADNVGDIVGDTAGMGSDLFESYAGSIIATIVLAATMGEVAAAAVGPSAALMALPLVLASVGLGRSALGIVVVRGFANRAPATALRAGTTGAAILFLVAGLAVIAGLGIAPKVAIAVAAGTLGGMAIGLATEGSTSGASVRKLAKTAETGAASINIAGLALGLGSTLLPVVLMAAVIGIASLAAGLFGVGIAAVAMLGTVAMTVATDGFGPIADNAGGIAEMARLGPKTRAVTDELDALGNTTAAVGKGFAIGAAALAALTIIAAYVQTVATLRPGFLLAFDEPRVLLGMLGGALVSAVLLALMMANSGAAWDNAKKYIEEGNLGGKGSPAHHASIIGDTVGDPFEDTAGPSLNILIKLMAIVSLAIAPLL